MLVEETLRHDYLAYINDICKDVHDKIQNKSLTRDSVHVVLAHLPNSSKQCNDEKVLSASTKCLHTLWKYSKEMEYIESSCSYDDFINVKFGKIRGK